MSIRLHPTSNKGLPPDGPKMWYIIISQGKGKPQKNLKFIGTEDEALAEDKRLNAAIKGERNRVEPTIADTLVDYTRYYKTVATPEIVKDMLSVMRRCLLPAFGKLSPRHIAPILVYRYHSARLDQGVTHRTIEKECNYLSAMVKWMKATGLVEKITDIPRPAKEKTKAPKKLPISSNAFVDLVRHTADDKKVALLLMGCCGLRRTEALTLMCEDVDIDEQIFVVKGKGGTWVEYPIESEILLHYLKRAIDKYKTGYLVRDAKGNAYKSLKRSLATSAKKAGITMQGSHHVLRHAYSRAAQKSGVKTEERQKLMRHATLAATEHYTHTTAEDIRGEARKVGQYLDDCFRSAGDMPEKLVCNSVIKNGGKSASHLRLVK